MAYKKHEGIDYRNPPGYIIDEMMDEDYKEQYEMEMVLEIIVKIFIPILLLIGMVSVIALVNYFYG